MKKSLPLILTALLFGVAGLYLGSTLLRPAAPENPGPHAAPFQPFLQQFSDDIRFQQERTLFPLPYITLPDADATAPDTFLVERRNWIPLQLFDSAGTIATIFNPPLSEAGSQQPTANSQLLAANHLPDPCRYTVTLSGIHHGQQMTLRFTLHNNRWHLEAFEDYSL